MPNFHHFKKYHDPEEWNKITERKKQGKNKTLPFRFVLQGLNRFRSDGQKSPKQVRLWLIILSLVFVTDGQMGT